MEQELRIQRAEHHKKRTLEMMQQKKGKKFTIIKTMIHCEMCAIVNYQLEHYFTIEIKITLQSSNSCDRLFEYHALILNGVLLFINVFTYERNFYFIKRALFTSN